MIKQILFCAFSAVLFYSCEAQSETKKNRDNRDKNVEIKADVEKEQLTKNGFTGLKLKETKFIKESQINITFNTLLEDSRCPAEVNCIWAGVAKAEFTIMSTVGRPQKVQLSTIQNIERGYHQYIVYNGYRIALENVTPYPKSSINVTKNPPAYIAVLQFTKIAENQIEPQIQ